MYMDQRASYLSNNVKKLVSYQPDSLSQEECHDLFLESGLLNWNAIEKICHLNECMSWVLIFIMKCNKEHWGVSGLVLCIQGCRGYCLKNPD